MILPRGGKGRGGPAGRRRRLRLSPRTRSLPENGRKILRWHVETVRNWRWVIHVTENIAVFKIESEALRQRTRNILWGAGLSLALAAAIGVVHYRNPGTDTDTLLWSIVAFVTLANLANYVRHRRYLRQTRDHRVEVRPGRVQFWTGGNKTELDVKDIAAINLYSRRGVLRHIQLRLKNNRGIRLESYGDLEGMAAALAGQIPKAHVTDRRI